MLRSHKTPRYRKYWLLLLVLGVALSMFLGLGNRETDSAACPLNTIVYTGHTPTGQYVDGVQVSGKIQHRGWVLALSGLDYVYSCIHGQVLSNAASSIDQVS